MADLVVGFVTSAFLCGIGVILAKRCVEFDERIKDESESEPEYILITKEHYETMKNNPDVKKIIFERPQLRPQSQIRPQINEGPLPSYSESETDALLLIKAPKNKN